MSFVLIRNPERKFGGALSVPCPPRHFGLKPKPAYGVPGVPDDTPYRAVDYARQSDGWADLPTSERLGQAARKITSDGIHMSYFHVGLDGHGRVVVHGGEPHVPVEADRAPFV